LKALFRVASLLLVLTWTIGLSGYAWAHKLDPGFLEIREITTGSYSVSFKVPASTGRPLPLRAELPDGCTPRHSGQLSGIAGAFATSWVAQCPADLSGGEIFIRGLQQTSTDVLVRIETINDGVRTALLTADVPRHVIAETPSVWQVILTYSRLGVTHILFGIDHILFVFALIMLVPGTMLLVKTITAFTVAHSITLSAAALGFVEVPGPPVEAVIALSIVFVAIELAKGKPGTLRFSQRFPWLVAFSFGLLHGFGFAGALSDTGLPEAEIPAALLAFNVGVEAGQLLFIALVLVAQWGVTRLLDRIKISGNYRPTARLVLIYGLGAISAFWLIERVIVFWA
jgi:hydrogenase/urease accessory protein HupE